ncbi:MAG: hypothetical protein IH886_15015 [Nitrospinae bacterium]|nr:hypothetical protein [Nitrospinota bacterium]
MPESSVSEKKSLSFRFILLFLLIYGLVHLSPALPGVSPASFLNGLGPQTVLAEEGEIDEEDDEDDEDDEDEEEEEEESAEGEESPEDRTTKLTCMT